MAKLDKTNIVTGNVITAADLANVYNALGGTGAADIMVSGTLSAMNGLTVSGSIIPHSGSAYDLGSGTYPWKDLHLSGSTIYLWSSAGTAETLSRGNLQNIKEGKPLRGKGSLSSATLQCNFIYRDDDTADGDSTNRIALLNDRIYVAVNNLYAWDAKHSAGDGHRMSFGTYILTGQAANYYFAGSISSNNTISADAFVGDGSQLSSVTAEWDGTHDGDAEINGNVGIGVTPESWHSDVTALQVGSAGGVWEYYRQDIMVPYVNVSQNVYKASGGDKYINAHPAALYQQVLGEHTWYVAPSATADSTISWTNTMHIANDGNVGIGTSAPGASLHVVGDIVATGDITSNYSDERLKKDIELISNPLDKIEQLRGIAYKYKGADEVDHPDYSPFRETDIGVLAQDVEKVLPDAVAPAPFDMDGTSGSKSGDDYLTVRYERIVPLLIESIKELKKQLEEKDKDLESIKELKKQLEEKDKDLETRIAALETKLTKGF